ncbi:hypothetical protein ACWGVR_14100 [Streptomyces xanthophaeus]
MSAWTVASTRANQSDQPAHFMTSFANTLRAIRQGKDVEGARRNLSDPTVVAAEIEALAAHRAATEGFSPRDPWQVA